ncbi:MAG: hypothetical protein U5R48_12445 [Gammaproteobacteria bacterium]|nr:hypothetical protein [Gammaproteobacteria bacterium]
MQAQGALERYGTSDPAHASGIVTVKADDADGIDEHLNTQNIVGSVRNEMLRLAPTYYNTTDEMEAIVDAVAAFGDAGRDAPLKRERVLSRSASHHPAAHQRSPLVPTPDVARQGRHDPIQVPDTYRAEERVDKFLARFFPEASRSKIQRSIRKGIRRSSNGAGIKNTDPVQPGDTIIRPPRAPPAHLAAHPSQSRSTSVYEDDHLLVAVGQARGDGRAPRAGAHVGKRSLNALLHHVDGADGRRRGDDDLDDADHVGLSMLNALPERPGN